MFSELAALAMLAYALWFGLFRSKGLPKGPSPPVISGPIPFIGCGLAFIKGPRHFLETTRAQYGDTFLLKMFGLSLFFTFSSTGLKSLYRIREDQASFTEATKGLLGIKVPDECLEGTSMKKFHLAMRPRLMDNYVKNINKAVDDSLAALGKSGEFEIFHNMKQLVHRVGFLSWVGEDATREEYMQRLIDAYEQMDPETGFRNLSTVATTILSGKRQEKKALKEMTAILKEIWEQRVKEGRVPEYKPVEETDSDVDINLIDDGVKDNLASLHSLYRDLPEADRYRKVGVDIFQFHVASQANMYAAISWTLIQLLSQDPKHLESVRKEIAELEKVYGPDFVENANLLLNGLPALECITHESLRLAQQSITLRKVVAECEFEASVGGPKYILPVGTYIATLLSITNNDASILPADPPLNEFVPSRYVDHKLNPEKYPASSEYVVSTFGHGFHACPGLKFTHVVFKIVFTKYLTKLKLTPQFKTVTIPPTSVGAIARALEPCIVKYEAI